MVASKKERLAKASTEIKDKDSTEKCCYSPFRVEKLVKSVQSSPASVVKDVPHHVAVSMEKKGRRVSPVTLPGELQQSEETREAETPLLNSDQIRSSKDNTTKESYEDRPLYLQPTLSGEDFEYLAFAYTAKSFESSNDNKEDEDVEVCPPASRSPVPPLRALDKMPMASVPEDKSVREIAPQQKIVSNLENCVKSKEPDDDNISSKPAEFAKTEVPAADKITVLAGEPCTAEEHVVGKAKGKAPDPQSVMSEAAPKKRQTADGSFPEDTEDALANENEHMCAERKMYKPKPQLESPIKLMKAKSPQPEHSIRRLTKNHPHCCGPDESGISYHYEPQLEPKYKTPIEEMKEKALKPAVRRFTKSHPNACGPEYATEHGEAEITKEMVQEPTTSDNLESNDRSVKKDTRSEKLKSNDESDFDYASDSDKSSEEQSKQKRPQIPENAKKLPSLEKRLIRLNSLT